MSSFTSRRSISLLILFVFALLSSTAIAQTITGSIGGTVTDANGGIVAGAAVMLVNDQTKAARNLNGGLYSQDRTPGLPDALETKCCGQRQREPCAR